MVVSAWSLGRKSQQDASLMLEHYLPWKSAEVIACAQERNDIGK